jgi:hypothetical protein
MADLQRPEQETLARAMLELDASATTPRGTLTSAEGRRLAFSGWSELAVAVEDLRAGSSRASAPAMSEAAKSNSERERTS